ncbi:hypothetical protein BDD12DRAFT_949521 [Trichophaea hybrida]|nr:hypothetical protein BDD12DRAFT_949521 [Trichophaea hybrida]
MYFYISKQDHIASMSGSPNRSASPESAISDDAENRQFITRYSRMDPAADISIENSDSSAGTTVSSSHVHETAEPTTMAAETVSHFWAQRNGTAFESTLASSGCYTPRESCAICMGLIGFPAITLLPCEHTIFCLECILTWQSQPGGRFCPLCRAYIEYLAVESFLYRTHYESSDVESLSDRDSDDSDELQEAGQRSDIQPVGHGPGESQTIDAGEEDDLEPTRRMLREEIQRMRAEQLLLSSGRLRRRATMAPAISMRQVTYGK